MTVLDPSEGAQMPRVQKSVDEQLAETRAKRARLDARLKQLGQRQKLLDSRKRVKGEKVLLRILQGPALPAEIRLALTSVILTANLIPEERDAAVAILTMPSTTEAA